MTTDMAAYWDRAGKVWVEQQALLDRIYQPVAEAVVEAADPRNGQAVLDVGCGAGATTFTAAWRTGPEGRAVGVDISPALVELARRRAGEDGLEGIEFLLADAQVHPFAPDFDAMVSRFGVMFFGNPDAAFANLRKSLAPTGRLVFVCWRKFDENPWMQIPLFAAYEHVPRLPKLGPEDPGPFSFADTERVRRILTSAGFALPRFTPRDVVMDISGGEGLEGAVYQTAHVGATSRALDGQPEAARNAAIASVRKALTPFATPTGVLLKGSIWVVEAEQGS